MLDHCSVAHSTSTGSFRCYSREAHAPHVIIANIISASAASTSPSPAPDDDDGADDADDVIDDVDEDEHHDDDDDDDDDADDDGGGSGRVGLGNSNNLLLGSFPNRILIRNLNRNESFGSLGRPTADPSQFQLEI